MRWGFTACSAVFIDQKSPKKLIDSKKIILYKFQHDCAVEMEPGCACTVVFECICPVKLEPAGFGCIFTVGLFHTVVVSMQMRTSVPFQTVALGLSAKTSAGRPPLRTTVYRTEAGFR